jgi:hypothetical protein
VASHNRGMRGDFVRDFCFSWADCEGQTQVLYTLGSGRSKGHPPGWLVGGGICWAIGAYHNQLFLCVFPSAFEIGRCRSET